MRGCRVRKLAVVIAIGALIAVIVKKLRGGPAPQFENHPTVRGGPVAPSRPEDLPDLVPAPTDPTVPASDRTPHLVPAPVDPTVPDRPAAESAESRESGEPTWVAPVDGACPDGYPIKAKVKSGIFHQPGGIAYDRTHPDRCYPSVAAAEADGLRAAKR